MGRVGRPTTYSDEKLQIAEFYLYNWGTEEIGDSIPSRVGLCRWMGIHKQTSYDWDKAHDEFCAVTKAIDTLQEYVAINKGITGVFNAAITKLILSNHGYSDKVDVDNKSSDGSMSPRGKSLDDFYGESKDPDSSE